MSADHELPPVDAGALALGHLARVLERRFPGILDEWVESLDDPRLHDEIVQLRPVKEEVTVRAARRDALVLARHIRLVSLAHMAAERRRRRKKT